MRRMHPDLDALAQAQDALLAEAGAGGFGPPEGAHWDAEHVLAHLVVNERLIEQVSLALAAGEDPDYDNAPGQDGFVLDTTIAEAGGLPGLIAVLRQAFTDVRAAAEALTDQQRARLVHVRIWHEGHRVVDSPQPWWGFAVGASTRVHLPAHLAQLRALR